MLQDPSQTKRIIRCEHQDLFSNSIQSLLKEGFAVKQLALDWQEQIQFRLHDDFSLRQLRFQDTLIQAAKDYETETADQQFAADALILTKSLSALLHELIGIFTVGKNEKTD